MHQPAIPRIHLARCTGCGLCEDLCPTHAVELRGGKAVIARPGDCTFCDLCESYCPEEAIARPFLIVFASGAPCAAVYPHKDSPMTTPTIAVDANETLNELVARVPEALPVLQRFGLDTCCGGSLTLAVAAQHHSLEVNELLTAIREALGEHVIDVRTIAPRERHPLIFNTFDALAAGEAFTLTNDHDPKPLFYQFSAEREGQFNWTYLERGPETWRVRIGRVGR